MKVYRRVKQTKYVMAGKSGLLTIHDGGMIAASGDHQKILDGLDYKVEGFYLSLARPSAKEKRTVMNRLFLLPDEY